MAERSFVEEVKKLRLSGGDVFRGEGILAVTKALLESGVSYVAGYQGAPISHLMDVLADAQDILAEQGIRFENSASEATAAATLAASVNYPLRGAVTFKATVGTNVASDALANLASGGVTGGALIIVGEDYGEGSSIMQERSHAFAMKSQIWLLDPRPNLPSIVDAVKTGFDLSEASNTPVMLQLRIRACHVHGHFIAGDNKRAKFTLQEALENPQRDVSRIVLPPASFVHEQEKVKDRWPAAVRFIEERQLNEFFSEDADDIGIIVQGGSYNTLLRALERLDLADVYGNTKVPLYVMNVAYPVIESEVIRFCEGKRAVLIVEEGQPNFVEQNLATILRQAGSTTALHGKDMLPVAGEYTSSELLKGARTFCERYERLAPLPVPVPVRKVIPLREVAAIGVDAAPEPAVPSSALGDVVHARPPGFCTGCPERPIFSAMKLVERELGAHHVSADIGCHLFSILPPFNIGNTTMGYGLGGAGASALNAPAGKRAISMMGDGGFWHNGLTSGVANSVFNKSDNLTIVVDNNYTSATGRAGHPLLERRQQDAQHRPRNRARRARRGRGVGEDAAPHLRRRRHARCAERSAHHDEEGAEGPDRAVGVHAQQAAPREAAGAQGHRRWQAHGARKIRRRFRHLHRRSLVHPPVGLPVALHQAQPRSAAHRPGRDRARQLRGLRRVRRGLACRGAVPLVLQGADREQPEPLGHAARARAFCRHRLAAARRSAPPRNLCLLKR
jgi:indolepyruvate ferredoxin oxidoreductase alpha subunit